MTQIRTAIAGVLLLASPALAQATLEGPDGRASTMSRLSWELRWSDEATHRRYEAQKERLTKQVLRETDGFVADNFRAESSAVKVATGIDALLAAFRSPVGKNVVFSATLPTGPALIIAIDLLRQAGATCDDAISIRAYRNEGSRLVEVASTGNDLEGRVLNSLLVLSRSPVTGESRFISLVGWPSIGNPYSLKARLYAFDGKQFRVLWTSSEFRSDGDLAGVIKETATGFSIRRLSEPDWHGIRDEYLQTVEGVDRVAEIEAPTR